jgi:hypothetical protein
MEAFKCAGRYATRLLIELVDDLLTDKLGFSMGEQVWISSLHCDIIGRSTRRRWLVDSDIVG